MNKERQTKGIVDFDLANIALSIINDLAGITITFYETQDDLDNDLNAISLHSFLLVLQLSKVVQIQ